MRTHRVSKRTLAAVLATLACGAPASCLPAAALADAGGTAFAPATPHKATVAMGLSGHALATYFGPGFFGHRTACGQLLTKAIVGVAHRTLPCGTLVEVSYGGHHLTVPVIDRGPYGRIGAKWDLTVGAARSLGITETVRIRAHVVGRLPNSPLLGAPAPVSPLPATPPVSPLAGGVAA